MSTRFYLSADEIELIQAFRQLSHHERHIIAACIQKSSVPRPDEDVPPVRRILQPASP